MDVEKLIHCLQCCARVDAHNIGCDDCGLEYCGPECQQLCGTAATALSTLQAENEKLRAELNDLKAQWDMYGGDEGITAMIEERDKLKAELEKYQPKEHWETLNELCENLHAELEQVKAERDAAVKCIEEIEDALNFQRISAIGLRISEWRGQED